MARPTKLDKRLIRVITKHIEDGLTYEDACYLSNVGVRTIARWKEQAEKLSLQPEESLNASQLLLEEFWQAIKKAEAECKSEKTKRIVEGRPGWQGSAWFLERRHPAQYGRSDCKFESIKEQNEQSQKEQIQPTPTDPQEILESLAQLPTYILEMALSMAQSKVQNND